MVQGQRREQLETLREDLTGRRGDRFVLALKPSAGGLDLGQSAWPASQIERQDLDLPFRTLEVEAFVQRKRGDTRVRDPGGYVDGWAAATSLPQQACRFHTGTKK